MKKKVVLAYSGGLDTSCCVKWLQDKGFEVVCFSANLGSEFSPAEIRSKAKASGIKIIYVQDLQQEFAQDYILPALKANAVYESKYVLSTALGRPLIAKYLVDIAHKEKAEYVAHGCTGKGNDQVRIDTTVKILDPKLKIIAPVREWELTSRESEIAYAKKNKIAISTTKKNIYSIDQNIWGISIEGGIMEDLANAPDEKAYVLTKGIDKTPNKPEYVEIEFIKGEPVKLNNKKMSLLKMIEDLNEIAGKHGIGRTDLLEDRIVGIKSREIYEAPAAWVLINAHRELESVVLDKDTINFKEIVGLRYAQLAYQGLWFSRLSKSLGAFVNKTQEKITGSVKLKLYKANIAVVQRKSKHSLYKKELATYGEDDKFNREDAKGFIEIFSLSYREK